MNRLQKIVFEAKLEELTSRLVLKYTFISILRSFIHFWNATKEPSSFERVCWQVYSQPVFAVVEKWLAWKYPNSGFVNNEYTLKLPLLPNFRLNLLRLCFRTTYVVSTTVIAMIFPYFNQVLGVIGALNFWPLSIYFPVEMYFVQRKIGTWTTKWVVLQTFSIACLIVSILALIGSVEGLISAKLS